MQFKPIIILALFTSGTSCKSQDLQTVPFVDLQKYAGLWYDISHLPVSFMKGCECTTAEYTITKKGYVKVVNRCRKGSSGKWSSIKGKAFVVPNSGNAKLKVQFFWPFKGNYWIIDLADDYSYAVVGDKSRKYLWILSRTPQMEKKIYDEIVLSTGNKSFPVDQLEFSKQSGCEKSRP
jgi:apolipoprotein D and lipocalin family protein